MTEVTYRSFELDRGGGTWTVFVPADIVGDADLHDWIVGAGEIATNRAIARAQRMGGLDFIAQINAADLR
jgi:hypothetical protein